MLSLSVQRDWSLSNQHILFITNEGNRGRFIQRKQTSQRTRHKKFVGVASDPTEEEKKLDLIRAKQGGLDVSDVDGLEWGQ